MQLIRRFLYCLFFICGSAVVLTAQALALPVNATMAPVDLYADAFSIIDMAGLDAAAEILAKMKHGDAAVEQLGHEPPAPVYWLGIQVHNQGPATDYAIKIHPETQVPTDLFLWDGDRLAGRATRGRDDIENFGASLIPPGSNFIFHLEENETRWILLRIERKSPQFYQQVTLLPAADFLPAHARRHILPLFVIATELALVFLTLTGLSVGRSTPLWFNVLLGSAIGFWSLNYGYIQLLFGFNDPNDNFIRLAMASAATAQIMFLDNFAGMRFINRWLHRWAMVIAALGFCQIIATPFLSSAFAYATTLPLLYALSMPTMLILWLVAVWRRVPEAWLVALGWCLWLVLGVPAQLANAKVLSAAVWHYDAILLGSAIEAICFALALARRVAQLRQEKLVADEASAAKSDFLAMMSHEIRTPLHGVLGYADLLAEQRLPARIAQMVAVIRQSGETLRRLIDDLLEFSRAEARSIILRPRPFNIRAALEDVVQLLKPQADEKGLTLSISFSEDIPPRVIGDVDRLQQILFNLVNNAIKFTAKGRVSVEVESTFIDAGTVRLCCDVVDTGMGIAIENQAAIFDRFQQIQPGKAAGVGLGLAITREITAAMKGRLTLSSVPGKGSRFSLTIDLPVDMTYHDTESIEPTVKTDKGRRVLVLDDHKVNLHLTRDFLGHLGHRISLADHVEKALAKLAMDDFDLVIADLRLPHREQGLDFIRRARALLAERSSDALILTLTASPLPEDIDAAREAGADHVLSKPLSLHSLRVFMAATHQDAVGKADASASRGDIVSDYLSTIGEANFRRAIEEFTQWTDMQMSRLMTSFAAGSENWNRECADFLHALKGSAAQFGLDRLVLSIEELEQPPGEQDLNALRSLFQAEMQQLKMRLLPLDGSGIR